MEYRPNPVNIGLNTKDEIAYLTDANGNPIEDAKLTSWTVNGKEPNATNTLGKKYYSLGGQIYVDDELKGIPISYGNFTVIGTYLVQIKISGNFAGTYVFTINVSNSSSIGYSPPSITINYSSQIYEAKLQNNTSTILNYEVQQISGSNMNSQTKLTTLESYVLQLPFTGTISVDTAGTITFGGFNLNTTFKVIVEEIYEYMIEVYDAGTGIHYSPESGNTNTEDPEDYNVYLVNSDGSAASEIITKWKLEILDENRQTVTKTEELYAGKSYNKNGLITVYEWGEISYGLFKEPNEYLITSYTASNTQYKFPLTVTGESLYPYYYPNPISINPGDSSTAPLNNNESIITSWKVNDIKLASYKDVYSNDGGTITIDQVGNLSFGGFKTSNTLYNVTTYLPSYSPAVKIVVGSTPIVSGYVPDSKSIAYKGTDSAILQGNSSPITKWTLTINGAITTLYGGETYHVGKSGYITVDTVGLISYGNFSSNATYTINTYIGNKPYKFTLTVSGTPGSVHYSPNDPTIGYNTKSSSKLDGMNAASLGDVSVWTVNGVQFAQTETYVPNVPDKTPYDSTGYIKVGETGFLEYGDFTKDNEYDVVVTIEDINYPMNLTIKGETKPSGGGDDEEENTIFGMPIWAFILIIVVILIIIIVIIVLVVKSNNKKNDDTSGN